MAYLGGGIESWSPLTKKLFHMKKIGKHGFCVSTRWPAKIWLSYEILKYATDKAHWEREEKGEKLPGPTLKIMEKIVHHAIFDYFSTFL